MMFFENLVGHIYMMCIDHSEPYVRCLNVSELLGKGRKKSFLFEKKEGLFYWER